MPLQQTSGAASYDAFGGGAPVAAKYIEDFFQTWLRTGTGSSTTVTTGLNASINKSLVWTKSRSAATNHKLTDTARGVTKALSSNTTGAEVTDSQGLTAFSSTGYTIGTNTDYNNSGATYVDWQWVATPKFFDVVTWTGNSVAGRQISHALGSVPGCIIVKCTSTSGDDWCVYHRSLGRSSAVFLNLTNASGASALWDATDPTSTTFTLSSNGSVNGTGNTYVAYLFAHNAGGFGLTGTDNVISCGSFTASSGAATVDLGYEPQWILFKRTNGVGGWYLTDNMRGWSYSATAALLANTSDAEDPNALIANPTATGFQFGTGTLVSSGAYIYIAIRRGPMRTPTTGTSVFAPALASSSGTYTATSNFPVDWAIEGDRASTTKFFAGTRLTGDNTLQPNTTGAESAQSWGFANMTGFTLPGVVGNYSGFINWMMRRAPGFFDVVCYTGTGVTNNTVNHNLGVVPEMMIVRIRNNYTPGLDASGNWAVYHAALGNQARLALNLTDSVVTGTGVWFSTTPTATTFKTSADDLVNKSASGYVAYLFASCPGVSKVGSYTGNGSSQTINMGFTGGARFFLVKRTDSTGDWWVYDSARGIVSAADPALRLNSTAAEVTSADAVDTDSTGLIVNQESTCNINVSSATYIYLGIS